MQQKPNQDERRMFSRITKQFMTKFRLYKGANYSGGWQISVTKDLSYGGCYLISDHSLHLNDILELEMQIPIKNRFLRLFGEIVRVEPLTPDGSAQGIGISFMKIDENHKEDFSNLLEEFLKTFRAGSR